MNVRLAEPKEATSGAASRFPFVGLLLVQLLVGYEWLMSGLTKVVRGGFPGGLAAELREKSEGQAAGTRASSMVRSSRTRARSAT